MRWFTSSIGSAFFFAAIGIASAQTQSRRSTVISGQAKIAAGTDWAGTFLRLCIPPSAPSGAARGRRPGRRRRAAAEGPAVRLPGKPGTPNRPKSRITCISWAPRSIAHGRIVGSQGIIILEALFDYATRDEILDGLKKVGLDPNE